MAWLIALALFWRIGSGIGTETKESGAVTGSIRTPETGLCPPPVFSSYSTAARMAT